MKNLEVKSRIPIMSWCDDIEDGALRQAVNVANLSVASKHVALMPDCHQGYGMPIGGVVGLKDAVCPNMVGVDIGCGMGAVKTNIRMESEKELSNFKSTIKDIMHSVKRGVPMGEGRAHPGEREWDGFALAPKPLGVSDSAMSLAKKNLGTLGGGNHFIELQHGDDGYLWMMIHSGSRNLGHNIATAYHELATRFCELWGDELPDKELAYLPIDSDEGAMYIRDMRLALNYAEENRRRIMSVFKDSMSRAVWGFDVLEEVNIHHNYASLEEHFGHSLWVHRKGATSAKAGQLGIIPGSMGTASYIVKGLGNPDSLESCSHGAGRRMGRAEACRRLDKDECDRAMEGVVFDGFKKASGKRAPKGAEYELDEAPGAYKDIEGVMAAQSELVEVVVKLKPLGVLKG